MQSNTKVNLKENIKNLTFSIVCICMTTLQDHKEQQSFPGKHNLQ